MFSIGKVLKGQKGIHKLQIANTQIAPGILAK